MTTSLNSNRNNAGISHNCLIPKNSATTIKYVSPHPVQDWTDPYHIFPSIIY